MRLKHGAVFVRQINDELRHTEIYRAIRRYGKRRLKISMPFQKGQSGNLKGKPKGVRAKAVVAREAEIKASGLTPLDYMIGILRDETQDQDKRFAAAKEAAPYVHPKLSAIDAKMTGDMGFTINIIKHAPE